MLEAVAVAVDDGVLVIEAVLEAVGDWLGVTETDGVRVAVPVAVGVAVPVLVR